MTANPPLAPHISAPNKKQSTSHRQNLNAAYRAAIELKHPTAIWQSPHGTLPQLVVGFKDDIQNTRINFNESHAGFAFSPFVNATGSESLFINADFHIDEMGHHLLPQSGSAKYTADHFVALYQQYLETNPTDTPTWVTPSTEQSTHISTQSEFCALVESAIDYIKQSGIKKIVASRATEAPLSSQFDPLNLFDALSDYYPHAFVSLVSIPDIGTWIGASPELLLNLRDGSLHTVALAGTQARSTDKALEAVRWGQKEIEEQALVSAYIRDFFHDIGCRNFSASGPRTVSAGNVVHLKTSFTVNDTPDKLNQLANQILYRLHPTSAVCGMPKNEALSFILDEEKYNRAFYSGFLGPVHINGESRLHVNLRCMQLKTHSALLYVGAGITADSNPEAEWKETVLKSKTLLSVL